MKVMSKTGTTCPTPTSTIAHRPNILTWKRRCRIAAKLPGRTNKDCRSKTSYSLRFWYSPRSLSLERPRGGSRREVSHTPGVAYHLATCTDDLSERWLNSVAGGLKKGQWAKSEDIQLERGVEQFGQRYGETSSLQAP